MIQCNEAPSNCSGRTRLARLPLRHPVSPCLNMMLRMQCEVTMLLCESNRCCVLSMVGKYTLRTRLFVYTMFGRAYGDEVAARHFSQDVFPVAEFQAGERILALFCVIGRDGYNEGDEGQSSICFWKVESRVTLLNVVRHVCLYNA